jgi:hypothetical protein
MIAKCANPECGAPFRYLREGRLFQVDRDAAGHRIVGPFLLSEGGPPHQLEHFWLEALKDEGDEDSSAVSENPAALIADVATNPNGQVLTSSLSMLLPCSPSMVILERAASRA